MMFLNQWEIEQLAERYSNHQVLGNAVRFLSEFKDEVNSHSDGWAYWRAPVTAAKQLMILIQNPQTATEVAYKKALTPIKSFMTRRGLKAGMIMPKESL